MRVDKYDPPHILCMCVHTYIYTYTYIYMYAYCCCMMYVYIVYVYIYVFGDMSVWVYIIYNLYMHICIYVYIYILLYDYTIIYIHILIHIKVTSFKGRTLRASTSVKTIFCHDATRWFVKYHHIDPIIQSSSLLLCKGSHASESPGEVVRDSFDEQCATVVPRQT